MYVKITATNQVLETELDDLDTDQLKIKTY